MDLIKRFFGRKDNLGEGDNRDSAAEKHPENEINNATVEKEQQIDNDGNVAVDAAGPAIEKQSAKDAKKAKKKADSEKKQRVTAAKKEQAADIDTADDASGPAIEKPSAKDVKRAKKKADSEKKQRVAVAEKKEPADIDAVGDASGSAVENPSAKEAKKAKKKADSEKKQRVAAAKKEERKKKKANKAKAANKTKRFNVAARLKKARKPKLTDEEKIQLKYDKQSAKHAKKLQNFERKAAQKEKKLLTIAEKKENYNEIKSQRRADAKAKSDQIKQRKKEFKEQKKFWRGKGVGKTAHRLGIAACIVAALGLLTSGVVVIYKSDKVNVPVVNSLAEAVINSPLSIAPRVVGPPFKWVASFTKSHAESIAKYVKGKPKFSDFYYYEPENDARYADYYSTNTGLAPDEVVWRVNAGCDLMLYELAVQIQDTAVDPLIVNKFNYLTEKYIPPNLVNIPDTNMKAEETALNAFAALQAAAAGSGHGISVASAYRSFEYQAVLYNPDIPDTREKPESRMVRPGFSEHQTGLAFDLCVTGSEMQRFSGTPEAAWVKANCERFGFLLRYTKEYTDVTGILEEPWHIRYVGDNVLKIMRDNDIGTLEEYKVKYIDHKEGEKPKTPEKPKDRPGHGQSGGPI